MKVIRYLDNEVIHQLINLSDEEFNKFIELFPNENVEDELLRRAAEDYFARKNH